MAASTESEMVTDNNVDKDKPSASAVAKEAENVRKSNRIKTNSRFEKHMSDYVFLSRRRGHSSSSDTEEDEVPTKVAKKSETKTPKPKATKVVRPTKPKTPVKQEIKVEVKNEPATTEDEEDEEEDAGMRDDPTDESFSLSMLNLRRVGEETAPKPKKNSPALNARGMPQRIRKKNRLFFDDNVVTSPIKKEKKEKLPGEKKTEKKKAKVDKRRVEEDVFQPKPLPVVVEESKEVNAVRQKIGMKLRNLLKLPKAQQWVLNEWFYSNLDYCLFYGSNDFLMCLKETFPHLKAQQMTRTEWCVVRRLMGKPRRCSQNFFNEERQTLERKRNLVRLIQQRKIKDVSMCKELPDKIPLQMSVNSRVTAKLRRPQSGLFTGKVDAVDPSNHTYRITFDRPGLGTHSIPDYEVMMDGEVDYVSLSKWAKRYASVKQSTYHTPAPIYPKTVWPEHVIAETRPDVWTENISVAKFPRQFYEMIIRICKILKEKRTKVELHKTMNTEAEKMAARTEPYPAEFQRRYATNIIELESLNISLKRYLTSVQRFAHDIAPDVCASIMLAPSYLRTKSISEAKGMVENYFEKKPPLKNKGLVDLVTELVALVIQVQNVTVKRCSIQERQTLQQSISKIKSMISPKNLLVFQNSVEVHIQYIETIGQENHHLSPLLAITS